MNITKEQADKVIAALSMNRIMARDENGNYTKEITAQVVVEALSIMRGLAEDAEPVARVAEVHMSRYTLEWLNGPLPEGTELYTSPQAAQTALKSESSAQAAQAPARLPSEGKPIEALALTEAQEREAFEAWAKKADYSLGTDPADGEYLFADTHHAWSGWLGRAGSKP